MTQENDLQVHSSWIALTVAPTLSEPALPPMPQGIMDNLVRACQFKIPAEAKQLTLIQVRVQGDSSDVSASSVCGGEYV